LFILLVALTFTWLWRESLGLPVSIDGILACTGLPVALTLLIIHKPIRSRKDETESERLGNCLLAGVVIIVVIGYALTWASGGTHRGTKLEPIPSRMVVCFLAWGLFAGSFFLLNVLGGSSTEQAELPTKDNVEQER
jgi:hypothetical protein